MSQTLEKLYQVVVDRKMNPQEGSYTCYLLDKGLDKILKKVGEETAETIIAAKNGVHPNLDIILNNSIGRCSYLEFLRQFKKLKAEKKFRLQNISIKPKSATIENEKYELLEMTATGCKTKAIFVLQNEGTYRLFGFYLYK